MTAHNPDLTPSPRGGFVVINSWLMALALAIPPTRASPVEVGPEVQINLGEPVIIALSEPGEMRWGYH